MKQDGFSVLLRNDDHIPYDFVLDVLQFTFGIDRGEAEEIALRCHREGSVAFGRFDCVAATLGVRFARASATRRGYPLSLRVTPLNRDEQRATRSTTC